jgi:hypothetical protein
MDNIVPVVRALTPERAVFVLRQEVIRSMQNAVDERDRASQNIAQVEQHIARYEHLRTQYADQVREAEEQIAKLRELEATTPLNDYFMDPCALLPVQARAIGGTRTIDTICHVSLVLGASKHMFVPESEVIKRPHAKALYDEWKPKAAEVRAMNSSFPLGTLEQLQSIIDAGETADADADMTHYPTLLPTIIDKNDGTMDVFQNIQSIEKRHSITIVELRMLSDESKHVVADCLRLCPLALQMYSARLEEEKSAEIMATSIEPILAPNEDDIAALADILAPQPTQGDDASAAELATPPHGARLSPSKRRRKRRKISRDIFSSS